MTNLANQNSEHAEEYKIIKHDLLRVFLLNLAYLAGIVALYYANRNSLFLERWFSKLFNF
jgi:hypothetical protein